MRCLVMHKQGTVEPETWSPPTPELMNAMGALVGELLQKKAMENGAGLNPKFPRTRITSQGGTVVERHGPLTGTNELLAHVAMFEVENKAAAIDLGKRYAKAVGGDVTLELGRVTEAWDLGHAPMPTGPVPEKYLLLHMADAASEAGIAFTSDQSARVRSVLDSTKVLMPLEHVRPSKEGRRLKFKSGRRVSAFDGPFAESKELISGFCLINLPSFEDCVAMGERYGAILAELEVDVLPLSPA
ncbi:MAG: hypothetical protein QM817_26455 [Archangium sp.]